MSKEEKQIKFRVPEKLEPRMRWAIYCEGGITQQEALERALSSWLDSEEQIWGMPVEPKAKVATPSPVGKPIIPKSRKATGFVEVGSKVKKSNEDDDDEDAHDRKQWIIQDRRGTRIYHFPSRLVVPGT